jgi:hypothetical protein
LPSLLLAVAAGGTAENWVGAGAPSPCNTCATNITSTCVVCTVRFGGSFTYSFNLVPGLSYIARFTFSEVYWTLADSRLFDVRINGAPVITQLDIIGLTGGRFRPLIREVPFNATTAATTISLAATKDNAILAALEVSG